MSLYERIKNRRNELNMSQEELATKLGYKSRSTIAKIEAGINDIPQSKIQAFADALETTPSYLMGWDDELAQIERHIEVLDARVFFRGVLVDLIKYFGYDVIDKYAKDDDGNTTVLLEGEKEVFEIKESDYNIFLNSCFSFIDYEFNKMIKEENRVKRSFSIEGYRDKDGKIEKYKYDELLVNAAHEIEGSSDEDKTHDDALMDEDDF